MSARIKYAYLKGNTWLYRRNYPEDVAMAVGVQALKQSLKTGDPVTARSRAAEVNACYEATVTRVRSDAESILLESGPEMSAGSFGWAAQPERALVRLRDTLARSGRLERASYERPVVTPSVTVADAARRYLIQRQGELRPSGFKSVRYSVDLFTSKYGDLPLTALGRDQGREFLTLIAQLSPYLGKSRDTVGLALDAAVRHSSRSSARITPRTQRRIWSQVTRFLGTAVFDGDVDQHPFAAVKFDRKVKGSPWGVLNNAEVVALLGQRSQINEVLLFCLLTGMRSGEATGLLRSEFVSKGNLGTFVKVQPNHLRLLKTDAAEREVPLHPVLEGRLPNLPSDGPLFPELTVRRVTKGFARLRQQLDLDRPGLVFHSTRKWFITQCERTGVPEHWTASLVGHQSARSENGITYGLYSAGIGDDQKRGIVDQIRLP